MRRLWIIGNSGAARECFWIFKDMRSADAEVESQWEFGGFLSWRGYKGDLKSLQDWFRGEALDFYPTDSDAFAIGIGEPALRADVYATMRARNAGFFTLIHPWSDISPAESMGEANIFQRGCSIFCGAVIGNANYFNGSVSISHDVEVGDANFFGPFALLLGGCRVGSRNLVAVRSTLLPSAKIGDDNIIAPGSILYKGCKNHIRMAGNPAMRIGTA